MSAGRLCGEESDGFEELWGMATLYEDEGNPLIQKFKLRGRYHGQFHVTEAEQGDDSDWEDRRSRFGFDARLFRGSIDLRVDFQSNDGFHNFYDGLVDAYVKWKPHEDVAVTVGKMQPQFSAHDWLNSSNEQETFERSHMFNQLNVNRATGFTVVGNHGALVWQAGFYANDTPASTTGTGSFGDFNGGVSYSLGAGYDFKEGLGMDKALLRADWVHSDREPGDTVFGRYDDIFSLTFWAVEGRGAVAFEAFSASGGDGLDSRAFGFYVQPMYDLVPGKVQLVGRYSYSESEDPMGLGAQSRYERRAGGGRGDRYHAFYLGAQYFIYGNKLKLMAGAEYSLLGQDSSGDGYDGFSFLTGVRVSF
ncbi:MAG: porin [Luteolibacter sp.]